MLADYAWHIIKGADEMKWNKMNETSVEKRWYEICGRGKWEKPQEKPTETPFRPPQNPHGLIKTQTGLNSKSFRSMYVEKAYSTADSDSSIGWGR